MRSNRRILEGAGAFSGAADIQPATFSDDPDQQIANDMLAVLVDAFEKSGKRMSEMDMVPALQAAPQVQRLAHRVSRLIRRFEETLDNIAVGVVMVDSNGRMQLCNEAALRLLDLPRPLAKSRPHFNEMISWQIRSGEFTAEQVFGNGWVSGEGLKDTATYFRRVRPNGTALDVRTVALGDGGFVRTFTDVTEDVRYQTQLAAAEAEYRGLFENATVGVYRTTPEGRQLRANPALVRLNGYDTEEEMLASVNDIAGEWYVDPARRGEFKALMERDGRVTEFVSEIYRHKTRERIWISENAWMATDSDGKIWYEGTINEVTQRIEAERRIAYLAMHDQATGISNRICLMDKVAEALKTGKAGKVAAFIIDLDGFKSVNDTFGHATGDELLRQVARMLAIVAGPRRLVARYGGDEFVIFDENAPENPAEVGVQAASLVQALRKPFLIGGRPVFIGGSVGVAIATPGEMTAEDLLRKADVALYRAKSEGKQTYRYFDPVMMADIESRLDIESTLRCAIGAGQFTLHYQPIVALPHRQLAAYEALIRWHHPVRGNVPPSEFIAIAESAGLMSSLGEWIISEACRQMKRMPSHVSVSINVSPVQLRDRSFVGHFADAIRHHHVDPRRLIVEITESVFLSHEAIVFSALNSLRDMGVMIALDDFGTGYSALSYLQRFRFDRIKLDQSFLRTQSSERTNLAIVRAILSLGRDLQIPIVAEGIEDEAQLAVLLEHGCAYAQGYLFGKPQPL